MPEARPAPSEAYFRHHPALRVRPTMRPRGRFDWRREPAITAYRHHTFFNRSLDRTFDVVLSGTPVILERVGVAVGSDDGFIRLYDLELKKAFWERRLPAPLYASPVFLPERQALLFGSTGGHVLVLALDSAVLWSANLEAPIYGSPAPAGDRVYINTFHQRLFCLDAGSGAELWRRDLPKPWSAALGGAASFRDPYASPAVTADGGVITANADHLTCHAPDGTLLWQVDVGAALRASPALDHASGLGIAGLVDGRVLLFEQRSGRVVATRETGARIVHSPAISPVVPGGIACIGNERGDVFGIALADGSERWRYAHGASLDHTSMTLSPAGDFVFVSSRGDAVCLAAESGRHLWQTSQHLQLANHERAMHVTPIVSADGYMVCASYSGYLYKFSFKPLAEDAAKLPQ